MGGERLTSHGLRQGFGLCYEPRMLLALILAAAPPVPLQLPNIPAPLGHVAGVVVDLQPGAVQGNDRPVLLKAEGCETPQVAYLMRFLGGTIRAVEQLQGWLDRSGQEKALFKGKQTLADVVRLLTDAKYEPRSDCAAPTLVDGFKLDLTAPPKKLCEVADDRPAGDFWFFSKGKPSAVISVVNGSPDACKPRLSAVLFDSKGLARVRFHSDWGAPSISANLLGDSCKSVDFTFDLAKEAFVPNWKTCKR